MKPQRLITLNDKQQRNFNAKLKRVGSCLVWTGGTTVDGYGLVKIGKKTLRAHRVAYYLKTGIDPGTLRVCHKCDNAPCCEPSHLFQGTSSDNRIDCVTKGRHASRKGSKNPSAKLTVTQARKIRVSNESNLALAALYGVSRSCINSIKLGKSWPHI